MNDFSQWIRDIPDFPKPGILYRDITPLLGDANAFQRVLDAFCVRYTSEPLDAVAGIEARGFIFGTALAARLGVGFIPIRKRGKLPYETHAATYHLEYGTDTLEIHRDAFGKASRLLLCDDLLATGGTLAASVELIEKLEGDVVSIAVLIELLSLKGREKLRDYDIFSLIQYED